MRVNIYHPTFWKAHGHWDYEHQTEGSSGFWKGFSYTINDPSVQADFMVVHDDLDQGIKFKANAGGFILVTGEEKSIRQYHQDYLNQFDLIITSRDDLQHPNVIRCHYLHPWRVKRNYDELLKMKYPEKPKMLSSIISNLTVLPSHKERFAFINKLKGHYKDQLDWFSKGENTFLDDKWDGLVDYQYSIAIENSSHHNYFTEKLSDCFLAYAYPFYSGCPNIANFFDDRSFTIINVQDFKKAIETIDSAIKDKVYEQNLSHVTESRRLVLEKYHFIAALTDILQRQQKRDSKVTKTIRPESYFRTGKAERLIKTGLKKIAGKI